MQKTYSKKSLVNLLLDIFEGALDHPIGTRVGLCMYVILDTMTESVFS